MFRAAVLSSGMPVLSQFLAVWVLIIAAMVVLNVVSHPRKGRYRGRPVRIPVPSFRPGTGKRVNGRGEA